MQAPTKIAIVGAGCSGSACAWQLAQSTDMPLTVTVFDMARGAGGRASTRRSRDCPGLFVNHGAIALHVREHSTLVSALRDRNAIVRWVSTIGKVNVDGSLEQIEDYFGTAHVYTSVNGMSNIVRGIFDMANVEVRWDTRISAFKPLPGGGWELLDSKGASVGEFDWLVVTAPNLASPRWTFLYGEQPPMQVAAELSGSRQLSAAVASMKGVEYSSMHVVMLTWALPEAEGGQVLENLRMLPFDVVEVVGDEVLARVTRQSVEPPFAVVVLYSTDAFSEQHRAVIGSGGNMARMVSSSFEREADVGWALQGAFGRLMTRLGGASPPMTMKPLLHRWGSAYPLKGQIPDVPAMVLPEVQVAFAGDCFGNSKGGMETALNSGLFAAKRIVESI